MVVRIYRYTVGLLVLMAVGVWLSVFQSPNANLRIVACDVRQGDAILVIYKNIQILTDGGANKKVSDCLNKYLPFYDREIELIVLTHPQKDHYFGLIEVFRSYKVDNFLYNPITVSSPDYKVLEKEVGGGGINLIHPIEGQVLRLGSIQLDILNPGQELIDQYNSKIDLNNFSIVYKLSFGSFDALLTGDSSPEVNDRIVGSGGVGPVEYIKIPHHGSRNGLTENLLKVLDPKIAVISVGKNNSYGHPHKEILDMLTSYEVKILRTDEMGDVIMETDGDGYWVKN